MVKQGYKQTEIGVIPEDWEVKKVSEISKITTGNKNTQDKVDNGIYPFFVRSQIVERINSFSFDGEAVLTAGDGVGVGKVFHYINGKFDFHQRVYAISHFDSNISGFYFFKYFQNNFYNRIMQMTAKSSVDSVRMETIADMQIPLPPLTEQEAIASALSDADAWIESLEQLIAKKRLIKQGAMQTLLTPKEDWEVKKVREIAKVGRGRVISHKEINGSQTKKYPVYSSQTTNNGIMGFIDTYDFDGEYVTWTTDGEKAGTVFHRMGKFNCTNVCGTIKLVKDNAKFISYILGTITPKHVSRNLANPKLMNEPMKNIELPIPSLSEQKRIARILSDMDAELEALATQLDKARQMKQGMMQELLTGRTRLV